MMLKLSKLVFMFSLLLLMSACNKDDDGGSSSSLIDTWTAESFNAVIETTIDNSGTITTAKSTITGSNLSYDLTFTSNAFTTAGGYNIAVSTEVDGMVASSSDDAYTNVAGSGTYTTSGNVMTVNGTFFDFTFNGTNFAATSPTLSTNYEINSDGKLVFSQDETPTTTTSGITATSKITSTSVWVKK